MASTDSLAFDRSSVRTKDVDGRLHVEVTNISKANVCPYMGKEIPDWELLGLDPEKIYQLYRDPDELKKAAPTFNNIPLLSEHVPVSIDDHQPELVVGSTGTDAEFVAPYLRNSLVVWEANAIAGIESNTQRELSCAYRYVPDMTPGVVDGISYDGVMREIRGNHVALVETGRAGSDVIVGDSKTVNLENHMNKKPLSRKAILIKGALVASLHPKLAADAKIDLNPILQDVTAKNYPGKKTAIFEALKAAVKGKLAADADMSDVVKLLDSLDGTEQDDDNLGADEEGLNDEEEAQYQSLLKRRKPKAEDEETDTDNDQLDEKNRRLSSDEPGDFEGKPKDPKAMDAAIKKASDNAVARVRAIAEAEKVIAPYVGEIVAQDSAEAVYKVALDMMKIDVAGVHPSAYRAILEAQKKPGETTILAVDHKAAESFNERFPEVGRIKAA